MTRPFALSAVLGLAVLAASAVATPATAPHAAACVAALKAQEAGLAETARGGTPVEPVLTHVVRSGIAIIGTQYLQGLREAEARRLLEAAEASFRTLPPATAAERQAECLREGQSIYDGASAFERTLIRSAAKRRVQRLTAAR